MGNGDEFDDDEALAVALALALLVAAVVLVLVVDGGTLDVDLNRWWHEFEGSVLLRTRDDCRAAEVVVERMAIMIMIDWLLVLFCIVLFCFVLYSVLH